MNCCTTIIGAATQVTPCECPIAGYCARHKMDKVPHFHKLCRTHIGYFDLYEQGNGPGQNFGPVPFMLGAGDVVTWLMFKLVRGDEQRMNTIGIKADKFIEWASRGRFKVNPDGVTCNCKSRHAWLNLHFPIWPIRWPRGLR